MGMSGIFMSGAEGRELRCKPRLGRFMLCEAGRKCRVIRTTLWSKPARDCSRTRSVWKRCWEKKCLEREAKPGEHDTAQRSSKGHMWSAVVKAADGTRQMRNDACPGDPARKRSLVTFGVSGSNGMVGVEG